MRVTYITINFLDYTSFNLHNIYVSFLLQYCTNSSGGRGGGAALDKGLRVELMSLLSLIIRGREKKSVTAYMFTQQLV